MCRWLAYLGPKIRLSHLITRPKNGIVQQSLDAVSYTPNLPTNNVRNHQVNADGFGISFYDASNNPHTYKSTTPAWSDTNLTALTENISTHLTLAHVRAATPGLAIMEANCHPFQFGALTFMHNGGIGGFSNLKRPLSELFPDTIWSNLQGSTDSEYAFHYFLTHLFPNDSSTATSALVSEQRMEDALRATIDGLIQLQQKYGDAKDLDQQSASMNFCVSNGNEIVASRMRRPITDDSPSLYYGTGATFEWCEIDDKFRFTEDHDATAQRVAIIASEPLTHVEEDWQVVPEETLITVSACGGIKLSSLV